MKIKASDKRTAETSLLEACKIALDYFTKPGGCTPPISEARLIKTLRKAIGKASLPPPEPSGFLQDYFCDETD